MKILITIISFVSFTIAAQGQINSAALDDACYQPLVGQGVDTIYGDKNGALLGLQVMNMGPWLDESYGRVGIFGLPGHTTQFSTFKTGTDFDLHGLKEVESFGNIDLHGVSKSQIRFCHFRSQKIKDLLVHKMDEEKIYWADENGKYDSSRYTILTSPKQGEYGFLMRYLNPSFTGYFTSDTVEDIIQGGITWGPVIDDSIHIYLYKGNNLHNQGVKALPDSVYSVNDITYLTSSYWTVMGDFRGTGRKDLILYANDTGGLNLLYYKNDAPFSMEKFYNAIRFDTLYSHTDNPSNREGSPHPQHGWQMQAFRRPAIDPTVDFMQVFVTNTSNDRSLWIFKGGPDFGSKRIYIDSPSYLIHHPSEYDSGFNDLADWFNPIDCGDMTGTGNRVLGNIALAPLGGNAGIYSFYVLGDAMDSKIDMIYVEQNHPSGWMDTLTANDDGLQDVIIGMPYYTTPKDDAKGWEDVGSIGLLHGSKKIPVHLNDVASDRERERLKTTQMYSYPNPLDQKTTLTFENCTSGVMYIEVVSSIGASVLREEIPDVDGLQQYAADLSTLPAGAYHIRLVCPADGWSAGTNVIKTGAAVTPWSLDLKKMVGK